MTTGRPLNLLVSFALPLMFGNMFQQLYTVVDTAIVGRGVGMDALAALGSVDWLNWMLIGIAQGISQGFSVRIAQKYGEGDEKGLRHVIGQSVFLSIILAILCTTISQAAIPVFLMWLHVPAELADMAELYTRILMGGFPAVIFYNLTASILRAVGDSKTPLKAMIAASFTNILLDCVAVFQLHMGIAGAAAATLIAQCLAGLICARKIYTSKILSFGKQDFIPHRECSMDLVRIGTPVALKNIIICLGGILIQSVVNGFGISFIAGFTATNKLYGILEVAAVSYGYAITTYMGQNFGARDYGRIRSGMRSALLLSVVTAVLIAAVMFVYGRPLTMLFISSDVPAQAAAAGNTAYLYLCFMSASLPILYLLFTYQAALQGVGNTVVTMVSAMIELGLRTICIFFVAHSGYENGAFAAEVAAWYGGGIFLMINYYKKVCPLYRRQKQ